MMPITLEYVLEELCEEEFLKNGFTIEPDIHVQISDGSILSTNMNELFHCIEVTSYNPLLFVKSVDDDRIVYELIFYTKINGFTEQGVALITAKRIPE